MCVQKEGAELKDYEIDKLRQRCLDYVNDSDPSSHLAMGEFTYTKMKMCFEILKSVANSVGAAAAASATSGGSSSLTPGSARKVQSSFKASAGGSSNNNNNQELESRILELEQLVQQRDNEIAIMVGMIRKDNGGVIPESILAHQSSFQAPAKDCDNQADGHQKKQHSSKAPQLPVDTSFAATFRVEPAILDDPTKAFEAFKAHYPKNDVIRENKVLLKQKYDAAKELATSVNDARNQIKNLTLQIEKLRKQQAITDEGLTDTDAKSSSPAAQEAELAAESKLKDKIEQFKLSYKQGFHELSELKKEIQHIQKMLEMSRIKLQKDFDLWYQRQGKGALLTETLVAQPKIASDESSRIAGAVSVDNNRKAPSSAAGPGRSVSPARSDVQAKSSLASSTNKRDLGNPAHASTEMKKPATPRSSTSTASIRSSTAR